MVQVLRDLGEQMDLSGTDLRDFIREQEEAEREKE